LCLGLAIVRRTAALLSHPLTLRSVPGRGSAFGIELPGLPNAVGVAPGDKPDPQHLAVLLGSFVVLIDGDADARSAMEYLLQSWSCDPKRTVGKRGLNKSAKFGR
jgi:hypothetical protein